MKLQDVIKRITVLDGAYTIYAATPWTCESEALVIQEPNDEHLPDMAVEKGLSYFLEVFIAQEFITGWIATHPTPPTLEEQCNRLIYYAQNDA